MHLLSSYTPTPWIISKINLHFDIQPKKVIVSNTFDFELRPGSLLIQSMVLDGVDLALTKLCLNGVPMAKETYELKEDALVLKVLPNKGTLNIQTEVDPYNNKTLEGLYASNGLLCTQNEPEGFRRITYFYDRPDVMCIYTTTILADFHTYPTLLSNGNLIHEIHHENGRYEVTWFDPFPKPSYLFALVAGELVFRKDTFITCSGKCVELRLYTEKEDYNESEYALACLKKAMRWDEETFDREYDLDIFMIVAVNDFNAGAMENKGLNIFNAPCVLASPQTATDNDYASIDRIVAHEYFHNWTGNRITCKNWFQLTLKEGLTMYRDAEYTADMHSRAVSRIHGVRKLRESQFLEDAGPLAHPIRPESYLEMNNFYTATVYTKGEEVIRMLEILIGKKKFKSAMDLYFARYDGQAITTEDFLSVFSEVASIDLSRFKNWYSQAGTPQIEAKDLYDEHKKTYILSFTQTCRPTEECKKKKPYMLPILIKLFDSLGHALSEEKLFVLTERTQTLSFENISTRPTPSLLRRFSAPVQLNYHYTHDQLQTLMKYDDDTFNRYDATQTLLQKTLLKTAKESTPFTFTQSTLHAWEAILNDAIAQKIDFSYAALALQLPSLTALGLSESEVDYGALDAVCKAFRTALAQQFEHKILKLITLCKVDEPYQVDPVQCGKRALSAVLWKLLVRLPQYTPQLLSTYAQANNMTEKLATLSSIVELEPVYSDIALASFYNTYKQKPLVMNKYFAMQAYSNRPDLVSHIKVLMNDPLFDAKNPNKVNGLIGALIANLPAFHEKNGSGYAFIAQIIEKCDTFNPQLSASLARRALRDYARLPANLKGLMLDSILAITPHSNNLKEVLELTLKSE